MRLNDFMRCILIFCLILLFTTHECMAKCSFAVNGDIPQNEPLFLTKTSAGTFEIIHTVSNRIDLAKDQQIYLACSGSRNYFKLNNKRPRGEEVLNFIEAKCDSGKGLKTDFGVLDISRLKCANRITGNLIPKPRESCASNTGITMNIGFEISNSHTPIWVDLFKTCFNVKSQSAIYTKHSLKITTEIETRPKKQDRPCFKQAGFTTVKPKDSYTLANQKKTFKSLHIDDNTVNAITNTASEKYLATGHLTPDRDFQFLALRDATYFYVNAVPHWQSINNGNSLKVERLVRLINSRQPLDIYTGVYDNYILNDKNANPIKLYLDAAQKIEVPKWIWKIAVTSSDGNKLGIAFVTLNNPFVTQENQIQKICTNVCEKAGFGEEDKNFFKKFGKGYTYCCEIDDLRNTVRTIPAFQVDGLLKKGPGSLVEKAEIISDSCYNDEF